MQSRSLSDGRVNSAPARNAAESGELGLRWFDGLQFKLGLLFVILLAVLAAGSWYASGRLVGNGLDSASFRYEREVNRRLAEQVAGITAEAQAFANTLDLVVAENRASRSQQKTVADRVAQKLPKDSAVTSFGLWPEPTSTVPGAERDSLFWQRDASGQWVLRNDYNDPDTIPYWREPWYTPGRLIASNRCYWTSRYRDLLTRQQVVTCTQPLLGARGFEGVLTVSVDLDVLGRRFAADTAGDGGYALLVDRDDHVLALSKIAQDKLQGQVQSGKNIADLGQKLPAFNPLTLALHRRSDSFSADALRSALYDAKQVTQLKDNTRDMARNEAESVLASIWNRAINRPLTPFENLDQPNDPLLDETGYAVIAQLPETDWQLASVTPTREGQGSVLHLITQVVQLTVGSLALILFLVWIIVRFSMIAPLRRMVRQLATADASDDALSATLDRSPNNELGALAHWFNERVSQMRDLRVTSQSMNQQFAIENAERLRAQDLLARAQERTHLALLTIDDGVVMLDERGHIDDMNPVAEQLLGVNHRAVAGTPFAQSFKARMGIGGEEMPNPATQALERGSRIEYADGVFIGADQNEREIYLAAAPMRARNGRAMGCVVVMRRIVAPVAAPSAASEVLDGITGLAGRTACERRVRALIDSARSGARLHALLVIDAGPARRPRGPESSWLETLPARIAELLAAHAGNSDSVFRLPGDRYAVTLESMDTAQALANAKHIAERLGQLRIQPATQPNSIADAGTGPILVSVGVCVIDSDMMNAMEAIRRGGIACDRARNTGMIEPCLYAPDQDGSASAADDAVWVQRIRRGLDLNQFHVTTQWIMPARAHAAEGMVFEALVALEDEEGFWAPASMFMPIADRQGLSGELDRWVIAHVFELLSSNAGLSGRVAFCGINLSNSSIGDSTLIDFVVEQLNSHPAVPAGKICFELREDAVGAHQQQAQRFCEALHGIGCRVAIDFRDGRQVANLDQLRRMPVDLLKIDSQQFRRLIDDAVEQTLAESTLRVAHLLQQRVIVTQIDDEAITTIWRRLGADYLQGYQIAKPTPVPFSAPN